MEMKEQNEQNIKKLAERLAQNHIQSSISADLQATARKQMLKDDHYNPQRTVVVVTGAGASASAAGLPLGNDTWRLLRDKLSIPSKMLETELDRLSVQYRLERNEFETQLLALSKFSRNQLLDELGTIFFRRFYTSLEYEILAHLLKHRFIDAIINFNFDELLDQAIDDEVGRENYHRIVSDGDMPDDVSKLHDENRRFHIPLYIKPHGTASHKSSLRFTREAYFLLPDNIHRLLLKLLSSTSETTLILIGFGMQSVEFTNIVRDASEKCALEVFIVDLSSKVMERVPASVKKSESILLTKEFGLSNALEDLWSNTCEYFHEPARPRGIYRHILLSKLFSDPLNYEQGENNRTPSIEHYLKDRTIVELTLAIAKAKGFVNVAQLAMSRAGRYFQHYREHKPIVTEPLSVLCEKLGLSRMGYSHDALRLSADEPGPATPVDELIIDRAAWNHQKDTLFDSMLAQLSPHRQQIVSTKAELLKDTLEYMYKSDEVEVYTPKESPYQLIFQKPIQLSSFAATKVVTKQMLSHRWDKLFCTAETGKWLLDEQIIEVVVKHSSRSLIVIVADVVHQTEIKETYIDRGINVDVVQLPWWLHNQHMTLIISGGAPKQGIYFERRQRSLSINPVWLKELSDLQIALESFVAYWIKATRFQQHQEAVFIYPKDLDEARINLLRR